MISVVNTKSLGSLFWPRALLKGPKRNFVVVVGVETWAKSFTNQTKNVRTENCFKLNRKSRVKVTKSSLYIFTALLVGLSDLFCGLVLPFTILHRLVWSCMVLYGILWYCMAFYGRVWFYGIIWSCMVFSREHRSKLIWSCFDLIGLELEFSLCKKNYISLNHKCFIILSKTFCKIIIVSAIFEGTFLYKLMKW